MRNCNLEVNEALKKRKLAKESNNILNGLKGLENKGKLKGSASYMTLDVLGFSDDDD